MSRRYWVIVLAVVALSFALVAFIVTLRIVSLIYTAAHPEALLQFAPPAVRVLPRDPSLHAARQAWAAVPWAFGLWLLALLACATALAVGGGRRRAVEVSQATSPVTG